MIRSKAVFAAGNTRRVRRPHPNALELKAVLWEHRSPKGGLAAGV